MFENLRKNSVAAAGFAALLFVGACASHRNAVDDTSTTTETTTVTTVTPGSAALDSNGTVSPTADGVTVTEVTNQPMASSTTETTVTESTPTTTETTTTTTVPMTSSTQETTTRTRLRKD